jgi:uncharacterized protein (DUF1697 family)
MVKMERVREIFGEMGLVGVRTFIQSGNVVFEAGAAGGGRLGREWCAICEKRLAGEARVPVGVILRSAAEMRGVVKGNPFAGEKGVDETKLHVTFLGGRATKDGLERLAAIRAGQDRFRVAGRAVYLHCPEGYGRSKLVNTAVERALGVKATTRNWRTVRTITEMMEGE